MVNNSELSVYYRKVILRNGPPKTVHNIKYLKLHWAFLHGRRTRHGESIWQLFAVSFLLDVTFLYCAASDVPGSLLTKPFAENFGQVPLKPIVAFQISHRAVFFAGEYKIYV